MSHRVSVTITAPGPEAAGVPDLLDSLARAHALDPGAVADMQVALDEALSNILRNGFADGAAHRLDVAIVVHGDRLIAELVDDCAPFDPLAVPPPDVGATLADRPVGGLGVHFVRHLMSRVSYTRIGDRNRLVLVRDGAAAATR
jgi:anti-sigma regulatory factor (Ser/Thr protein kinase)